MCAHSVIIDVLSFHKLHEEVHVTYLYCRKITALHFGISEPLNRDVCVISIKKCCSKTYVLLAVKLLDLRKDIVNASVVVVNFISCGTDL